MQNIVHFPEYYWFKSETSSGLFGQAITDIFCRTSQELLTIEGFEYLRRILSETPFSRDNFGVLC